MKVLPGAGDAEQHLLACRRAPRPVDELRDRLPADRPAARRRDERIDQERESVHGADAVASSELGAGSAAPAPRRRLVGGARPLNALERRDAASSTSSPVSSRRRRALRPPVGELLLERLERAGSSSSPVRICSIAAAKPCFERWRSLSAVTSGGQRARPPAPASWPIAQARTSFALTTKTIARDAEQESEHSAADQQRLLATRRGASRGFARANGFDLRLAGAGSRSSGSRIRSGAREVYNADVPLRRFRPPTGRGSAAPTVRQARPLARGAAADPLDVLLFSPPPSPAASPASASRPPSTSRASTTIADFSPKLVTQLYDREGQVRSPPTPASAA